MMPKMDWFESLATIRNLAPSMQNTKIIMFSNLSSQNDIDKAMKYWADWYILKANNTPAQVVSKIKSFLKENTIICPHCLHEINCPNTTK